MKAQGRPSRSLVQTNQKLLPENRSHSTGQMLRFGAMSIKQFAERSDEFWRALHRRDSSYEGIFIVGVKTTGIFCRPVCPARKPLRKNVEFFSGSKEALYAGYRPCLRCRPMTANRNAPTLVEELRQQVERQVLAISACRFRPTSARGAWGLLWRPSGMGAAC